MQSSLLDRCSTTIRPRLYDVAEYRQKMIEVQPDVVVVSGHTYTNVTIKEFLGELAKKVNHNPASLRQFNQTEEETVPEPPVQPWKKLTRRRLFLVAQRVVTSNSAVIAEQAIPGSTLSTSLARRMPL